MDVAADGPAGAPRTGRDVRRVALGLWVLYVVVVVGTAAFVAVAEETTWLGVGDGLSGVWLFAVTMPASLVVFTTSLNGLAAVGALCGLGVVQAGLLLPLVLRRRR